MKEILVIKLMVLFDVIIRLGRKRNMGVRDILDFKPV